jgi:hypothetical protein
VRRIQVFVLTLFLALAMIPALASTPAYACDCVGYDFDEAIAQADLIADVTVRERLSGGSGLVTYDVVVHTVWKGEQSRQITFVTDSEITACGLGRIPRNTDLLVWALGADGHYGASWCGIPMDGDPATDRERLTEKLGEPADLTDQRAAPRRSWVLTGVGVPVAVLSVGLIIWVVQRSRRARR